MRTISILGSGWLGLPLGASLRADGHTVRASTTTNSRLRLIAEGGMDPFLIDLNHDGNSREFFDSDALVIGIPPRIRVQGEDRYLMQLHRAGDLARQGKASQVVFISSTSVYPDLNRIVTEGDVDEKSTLAIAESLFRGSQKFLTSVIRLGGLVGPGRHPGLFLSGKTVSGGSAPVNVIHLDDCISIVKKVLETRKAGVWNVCADLHPTRKEFYEHASRDGGFPLPEFVDGKEERFKIVDSSLLKRTFGYSFKYPDPMKMTF